jgi:transcriptional regulator with GAF, ATPase, and Fis domain
MSQLDRYHWPGNIREPDNIISRAVIISQAGNLQVQLPESDQDVTWKKSRWWKLRGVLFLQKPAFEVLNRNHTDALTPAKYRGAHDI